MHHSRNLVVLGALSIFVVAAPAQAQFGGLKNAIKKKASEAIKGKDTTTEASSTPPAQSSSSAAPSRASARIEITPDVMTQFQKGLNAEIARRDIYVKRGQCEKQAQGTPEYMNVMAANGPEMEKIQNSTTMSDDQKMAAMQKIGQKIKDDSEAFFVKKCGAVIAELSPQEYEGVGAEAAGLERAQYAMLKERVRPFCENVAKGGGGAANANLVYTDSEMAAIKPQCPALLSALRKTS